MGNNPISYKDFFDFSDRAVVESAIRDLERLNKAYTDFVQTVTGSQLSTLAEQQKELAQSVRELVAASKDLSITNKEQQKTLLANAAAMADAQEKQERFTKAKKDTIQVENILAGSVDGLTARLKAQLTEFNKLDPAVDGHAEKIIELGRATQQTRTAIQQITNETKVSAAQFTVAKGSYLELDAATKQLRKDLLAMADGFNPANTEAQALTKQIAANTERLKAFDAAIGTNNRNVGNYSSAFNGLNNATSQIFRELPSAAVSMNTFFLAISNNLPILFDELQKTNALIKQNKEATLAAAAASELLAREQAIATGATEAQAIATGLLAREQAAANVAAAASPTIWRAIGSAVFSFNTLLTLAVVGLTFFGGSIINFFTGSSEASKKAKEDAKKYAESLKDIEKNSRTTALAEASRLQILVDTAKNTRLEMSARNAAVDELITKNKAYFGDLSREAILQGKVAAATRDAKNAIFEKAAGEAALGKFSEASKKTYDLTLLQELAQQKLNTATSEYNALNSAAKANPQNARLQNSVLIAMRAQASAQTEVDKATKDVNSAIAQQNKYYNDAAASGAKLEKINEGALGLGRTPARIQHDLDVVNAQLEVTADKTERHNQLLKEQTRLLDEQAAAAGKDTPSEKEAEKEARARKAAETAAEAARRKADELAKKGADLEIAEAERVYAHSLQQSADQFQLEETRYNVTVKYADLRLKIYDKDTKGYEDAEKDKVKAEAVYNERRVKLYDDTQKKIADSNKNLLDKVKGDIKTSGDAAIAEEDRLRSAQENNIALRVAGRKTTPQDAERQLHDLRLAQLREELEQQQAVVDSAKDHDEDYFRSKQELSKRQQALDDENASYAIRKKEEEVERKKQLEEAAFQFVSTLSNGLFDITQANYEQEIADLQTQHDTEIALAGSNANAKTAIDKKFKQQQSAIKRQEAEAAKEGSILNIGITTAENIVKAYPNPYLMAAAAALGALEIGIVAAKPIPNYFRGRNNGPAEIAEVNERGWELIQNTQGKFRVAGGGGRTLTRLSSGDKVLTHEQSIKKITDEHYKTAETDAFLQSVLAGQRIYVQSEDKQRREFLQAVSQSMLSKEALTASFSEAVGNLPMESNVFDIKGHNSYLIKKNSRINQVNKRQTISGNG